MKPASTEAVIHAARSWIGTPYHDQASVKGVACDCLGLARGVWRDIVGDEPFTVPAYSRDWGECGGVEALAEGAEKVMIRVAPPVPCVVGSLVIFRMEASLPAKHIGIVVADDRFVQASESLGIVEHEMSRAWIRRIAYAFLYPSRPVI